MQYYTITKKLLFDFHNKPTQVLNSTIIQKDLFDYADNESIEPNESKELSCKTIYDNKTWYTQNVKLYSNIFPISEIKKIQKCYNVKLINL